VTATRDEVPTLRMQQPSISSIAQTAPSNPPGRVFQGTKEFEVRYSQHSCLFRASIRPIQLCAQQSINGVFEGLTTGQYPAPKKETYQDDRGRST
jgi:hypothetical protein